VIERNEALLESPETIAEDPYHEGWLIKLRVNSFEQEDLDETLTAREYRAQVEGE
jgi:glycine cleavage system H protein